MSLIEHARGFMRGIRTNGAEVGAEHRNIDEQAAPADAAWPDDVADLIEEWETQPHHH